MGFTSKRVFIADSSLIPTIAEELSLQLQAEGYNIEKKSLFSDGIDIFISQGNIFKAVLGMNTALKITIISGSSHIIAEAAGNIFALQAIPSIISIFFFWPVMLTQIWGMIQQSKLSDKAIDRIDELLQRLSASNTNTANKKCNPESEISTKN